MKFIPLNNYASIKSLKPTKQIEPDPDAPMWAPPTTIEIPQRFVTAILTEPLELSSNRTIKADATVIVDSTMIETFVLDGIEYEVVQKNYIVGFFA